MRAAAGLLVLALALAGCTSPGEPPPPTSPPAKVPPSGSPPPAIPPGSPPPASRGPTIIGPTWALGDAWTYTLRTADREVTQELVVFRADDEHWWLGLENRTLALEHALRDTNPLIGRIHYGILSPHESGVHAGMYAFPLEDGKGWSGNLFGGTWQFQATWDAAEQKYDIAGTGTNASRIALDFDPAVKWFSAMRVEQEGETTELALQGFRSGATGTFHFFRGPELHAGPGPAGPLSAVAQADEVAVEDGYDALGLSLVGTASGPGTVIVLDPANQEQWRRPFDAGQSLDELVELPATAGTWRIAYLGLQNLQAETRVVGLETHVETV